MPTKRFNEAVRRNLNRFPVDFCRQLSTEEFEALRSQSATLKAGRGEHRKYPPLVFTEHGAIMAATLLNSPRAIDVSVFVVRAFVKLRELAETHQDLARRLDELETVTERHALRLEAFTNVTRKQLKEIFEALRALSAPANPPKRPIGFLVPEEKSGKDWP